MADWKRKNGSILIYSELNDKWVRFSDDFGVQCVKVDILTGDHYIQIFVNSKVSGRNTRWLLCDDLTRRSIMGKCYRIGLRVIDVDESINIVQQVLMEDFEQAPVIFEHDCLGMVQLDDQEIFLLDSPLGISGPKSASHYLFPALRPKGCLTSFTAGMEKLVFRRPTLETALAIGAVAPVSHILREEGIIDTLPIIALIGSSSSGKTTSLRTCAAIWARPTEGNGIIDNLFATENAFFAALERSKAFPSFIDETTAAQSVGISWHFDQMIYLLAQGKGKDRCNASGKLRHTPEFSGCVVFTGEESLLARTSKHQGLFARILELTVDHWTDSDVHADAIRAFITRNYGTAAPVMMWWLLQNRRKIARMFEDECNDLSKLFVIYPGVESRLVKIAAQIMVGARVLNASLDWMLDLHAMRKFLVNQLVGSRPQRDKISMAYETILQLICEHASKFIRERKRDHDSRLPMIDAYGTVGYYHSAPCVWILAKRFTDWLEEAKVFDPNEVTRTWVTNGWLVDFGQRHYVRKHAINGMSLPCYCILLPESQSVFDRLNALSSSATVDDISMALNGISTPCSLQTAETKQMIKEASEEIPIMKLILTKPCEQHESLLLNPELVRKLCIGKEFYVTILTGTSQFFISAKPINVHSVRGVLSTHSNGKICRSRALFRAIVKHFGFKLAAGEGVVCTNIETDSLENHAFPVALISTDIDNFSTYRCNVDIAGWNISEDTNKSTQSVSQINTLLADTDDDDE